MEHIATPQQHNGDSVERILTNISRFLFLVPLGLLPILFVPGVFVSFEYSKIFPAILATFIALVFFSLAVLRTGVLKVPTSVTLIAFWGIAIVAVLSALLSGDSYDALIGDTMSVQSALFSVFLATVMTMVTLVGTTKTFVLRLYVLLTGSALLLGLFHIVRLLFGPDVLQFGIFANATSSILGSWNDVALLYGLCIIVSLVVLEQLPLTKWGRILFMAVTGIALIMLAVVNFFAVWLVLALVSLLVLMYSLVKDRIQTQPSFATQQESTTSVTSIITSALVFIVATTFIVGGTFIGGIVSNFTDISYVEVRPSTLATLDIGRSAYGDNFLFSVGPNRFADAWRQHLDSSLNQTIFWNTPFSSGSGYILTQMVTNGILSVVAWVAFLGLFVYYGIRTLVMASAHDKVWYFIASSSFVAALYLWGMSMVYNPGVAMLVLTALLTGVTITAGSVLRSSYTEVLSVFKNKASAFILIGVVMVMIIGSSLLLYSSARHYAAVYAYTDALQLEAQAENLEQVETAVQSAINTVGSDTFYNRYAQYQLLKMESLLGVEEPTTEQQQQFEQATAQGVSYAQQAVNLDRTEPRNWITLARVYAVLSAVGIEGAAAEAAEAFAAAQRLAPQNPAYVLAEAQFQAQSGEVEAARERINDAITLKPNYVDALFLLTQLEAQLGNTEEAVQAARSMVTLEPNNAARVYQLGILESAAGNLDQAVAAFERAVQLDQNFANARYFLALGYLEQGNQDGAEAQLERVQELNPDNEQVTTLLDQVRSGSLENVPTTATESEPLEETSPVSAEDETVTTTEEPDTSLIVPVNPVADEETDAAAETETTE